MRVYFEKPRSTVGWKGLINDPALDGSGDVNTGLRIARALLLDVIGLGLPVGCEFLDPITPQYIADTVAWGAIGARTVESQVHRQLASGLSMPIGMKNRPDGSIATAVDAIRAAGVPHVFPGIDVSGAPAILHTRGNADGHLVLRGGNDGPNYDADSVAGALALLRAAGLPERLVIDASHGNSGKDHRRQPQVAADVGAQLAAGQRGIAGVMLESFLPRAVRSWTRPASWRTASRSPTPAWAGTQTAEVDAASWRRRCGPAGRSPPHRRPEAARGAGLGYGLTGAGRRSTGPGPGRPAGTSAATERRPRSRPWAAPVSVCRSPHGEWRDAAPAERYSATAFFRCGPGTLDTPTPLLNHTRPFCSMPPLYAISLTVAPLAPGRRHAGSLLGHRRATALFGRIPAG